MGYTLQPGDRIIQPIFETGLSKHHSIYLGQDHRGQPVIAENDKHQGVIVTGASDFFSTVGRFKVQPFRGSAYQRQAAVRRALYKVGAPYDLINFNCEHYAEYVQTGRPISRQVERIKNLVTFLLFILVISCLIFSITPSKKSK